MRAAILSLALGLALFPSAALAHPHNYVPRWPCSILNVAGRYYNQPVPPAPRIFDVNHDGWITLADLGLIGSRCW